MFLEFLLKLPQHILVPRVHGLFLAVVRRHPQQLPLPLQLPGKLAEVLGRIYGQHPHLPTPRALLHDATSRVEQPHRVLGRYVPSGREGRVLADRVPDGVLVRVFPGLVAKVGSDEYGRLGILSLVENFLGPFFDGLLQPRDQRDQLEVALGV